MPVVHSVFPYTMQLVAVKADEWRRRTSKVMGQAKPQLGLVRELFNEGRDLGLEETGEVDYRFRLWTISRKFFSF